MIHICQDERGPIGRPPIVRERVLACLRKLQRARVARIAEELKIPDQSVWAVLRAAHKRGEVTRYRTEGWQGFDIYEIGEAKT